MARTPSLSGRMPKGRGGNSRTLGRFPDAGFGKAPIRDLSGVLVSLSSDFAGSSFVGSAMFGSSHHEIRFVGTMVCLPRGEATLIKITFSRRSERLVVRSLRCWSIARPFLPLVPAVRLRHRMPRSRFRRSHSRPGTRLIHNRFAGSCSRTRRDCLCPPCHPSDLEGLADLQAPLRLAARVLPGGPAVPPLLAAPAVRPRPLDPVGPVV